MIDALNLEIKNIDARQSSLVYGRSNELNKLVRILTDTMGSATLISGDRGSGKTSTIREAITRLEILKKKHRSDKYLGFGIFISWTRQYVVFLDVPLVPNDTPDIELRKNVLRLMVQSLVSDYYSSSVAKKLFLPVGYRKDLNELEAILLYKRIVRSRTGGLKAAYRGVSANTSGSVEYEYDLAYTDIELKLKSFFTKYSKHLTFVVVFDELDKYLEENTSEGVKEINPHQYMRELKNLLTATYAKFIFTSTQDYYQEVNENLSSHILELGHYKFNLFTHKILINQLEPEEYSKFLKGLFSNNFKKLKPFPLKEFRLFEQQMLWYSNGYPFISKKKISELATDREDGTSFIDLLDVNEQFSTVGTKAPALQYVLSRVYKEFSTKNELTNRYLYKSLKKVADILYSGREITINKSNFYAIIFDDIEFTDEQAKKVLYGVEFNPHSQIEVNISDMNKWEIQLDRFDSGNKALVNEAITNLIWRLDSLDITMTDFKNPAKISEATIYLADYTEDELVRISKEYEKIESNLETLRARLRSKQRNIHTIEEHAELDTSPPTVLSLPNTNGTAASGVPFSKGWELKSIIEEEITALDEHMLTVYSSVAKKFIDQITQHLTSYKTDVSTEKTATSKQLPSLSLALQFTNSKVHILFNPSVKQIEEKIEDESIDKTVVIYGADKADQPTVKNNFKLKYFYFSNNKFSNFVPLCASVVKYLEKYRDK